MEKRGKNSRPLGSTDFVKPVRSAEEKALYHDLHLLHTKKKRTDWLGFCTYLNVRMLVVWQQTKTLCNMCLKSEEHLQLKEIVLQASQAEVMHTTSTVVACQLKLILIVSNLCRCSQQGTNREPVEALLTASGHVQDAERMLQRMCCWLIMTAYCTSSALAKTLGSMQIPRQYTAHCLGSLPTLMTYSKDTLRLELLGWHCCQL